MTATSRRRTDLLALELAHERISIGAHAAGRAIEDTLARLHHSSGALWGERVDASRQADLGVLQSIEAARRAERAMARVSAIVGTFDARLIRRILGDRTCFEECAALEGKVGARGTSYVAARFRDALEELAAAAKSVGPAPRSIVDKYSTAAEALNIELH